MPSSSIRCAVSTFAWVAGSRPPRPRAVARSVPAGIGPHVPSVASSAAPVGVQVSISVSSARTGAPASSDAVAGAGRGSTPCAPRTVPCPSPTGPDTIRSTPSASTANHTPTMSTIASTAPTSWKWTSSIVTPCAAASISPSRRNVARAPSLARPGSGCRCQHRVDLRPGPVVRSLVGRPDERPRRGEPATRHRFGGDRPTVHRQRAECRTDGIESTPKPTSAPSSMSPEAPNVGSIQSVVVTGGPPGASGAPRTRRRSRCRCRPR